MKLETYKIIKGTLTCKTGLRIGGTANTIEIGGVDNPIIRNPVNDQPYIPGSSLKGKIRTLLEWKIPNKLMGSGEPHSCEEKDCPICRIFGTTKKEFDGGPTRAIFRDAILTKESLDELNEIKKKKGLLYSEIKTENVIDRIKGKTKDGGLRQMERVPAGTKFDFEISYRIFDMDGDNGKKDEENFKYLLHGLWMLTQDCLGGSGSRGYGKVEIEAENEKGEPIEIKEQKLA